MTDSVSNQTLSISLRQIAKGFRSKQADMLTMFAAIVPPLVMLRCRSWNETRGQQYIGRDVEHPRQLGLWLHKMLKRFKRCD